MSTTLTTRTVQPVSQPRQASSLANLQTPSARDLEIYNRVKIQLFPQWEVAQDKGLHYSRVCQIVKRVHRWIIAGGNPAEPALRDHAARLRLSRASHQLRLMRCLEIATILMEAQPYQLETTKRRMVQGQEMWCEVTKRDQPNPKLPAVRLVLQTTQALRNLEERQNAQQPVPAADQDLLPAIFDLLCTLRIRAQADGRLQNTSDVNSLVASTLNNLLGTQLTGSELGVPVLCEPKHSDAPSTDSTNQPTFNLSAPPADK